MTLRLAAFILSVLVAGRAVACPEPSEHLLFHSCWGAARAELRLLPEDLKLSTPETASLRLMVTGAYTGTVARGENLPNPVGLFLRRGLVVNRNLGRMDGVLLIDPAEGRPELHHRARVAFGGRIYDLTDLDLRHAFVHAASVRGTSVMQSHLLIVDGEVDVRQVEDAPEFVRRILFTDDYGFGIYQTRQSQTLHAAASGLAGELAPRMALNLDMGSYDYCQRVEGGAQTACGSLGRDATAKLSNLLVFSLE